MIQEPRVLHHTWKSFSGPVIRGTIPAFESAPTMSTPHLERALWLTTMVESGGKFGTVMMADGTACTASLEQLVAVYPRDMSRQGPLFKMLRRMDMVAPVPYYLPFEEHGWRLGEDGVLRRINNGQPVDPKIIRDTFTPVGGKVPKGGPSWDQAKEWAIAFHGLFALEQTRRVQIGYGIEQLVKYGQRLRSPKLDRATVEEIFYNRNIQNPSPWPDCPEMDLAMCLWWNYHVNGPSPAITALANARLILGFGLGQFARRLINELRTSRYGRWATNRYDRSREHACEVWPRELFEGKDAVMPARRT